MSTFQPTFSRVWDGAQLKYWRQVKGMNQTELAGKIGVTRNTLSGWERGMRPTPFRVQQLADALGCSFQVLSGS